MPLYRFCVNDTIGKADWTSVELPGPDEAFAEAVRLATQLAQDDPEVIWREQRLCVDLTDDDNRLLLEVTISAIQPAAHTTADRAPHSSRRTA